MNIELASKCLNDLLEQSPDSGSQNGQQRGGVKLSQYIHEKLVSIHVCFFACCF